ncbi:hypothetical protein EYC84_008848 [Monilinia fructicola]|uniref:Uncharacterized protein n=1 Tax=Monilinia fructicola TaxID=38448 RepID=A0A5M9J9F4_MONFR|nr:hypothetical protein EYC84_008848 [Monilinia fructicola]
MDDASEFVQQAKIVVVFPNIGTEELVANAARVIPGVSVHFVQCSYYFNDPPSDAWVNERDAVSGDASKYVSPKEAKDALSRLIAYLRSDASISCLMILDDNSLPGLNVVGAMELIDLDFTLVSPARTDINLNRMPRYRGKEMQPEWLVKLELLKDQWDAFAIPERKRLELPAGSLLMPTKAAAKCQVALMKAIKPTTELERTTHSKLCLSHSQASLLIPPTAKTKAFLERGAFSPGSFSSSISFLTIVLVYMIYNIALEYENFAASDVTHKRAILEDPSGWVEESPFYVWTAWPRKLVRMALPYASKRRQVSEELLDTVEKWVHTERFLRASDPGWKFSDVLQRLRQAGFITSDPVKKEASEVVSTLASTVTGNVDDRRSIGMIGG